MIFEYKVHTLLRYFNKSRYIKVFHIFFAKCFVFIISFNYFLKSKLSYQSLGINSLQRYFLLSVRGIIYFAFSYTISISYVRVMSQFRSKKACSTVIGLASH